MKKLFSLLVALMLVLNIGMVLAEEAPVVDPETVFEFNPTSHVTTWEGEWVLVAAYIGEEYAEDCDIEVSGLIAVPENAVTMTVVAELDRSANNKETGPIVDQAQYWHAHVYDMVASIKFAEDITDDEATVEIAWDGWYNKATGEGEGIFNMGVGKLTKVSAGEKSLYFTTITGVDSEDIDDDKVKYMGMNTADQLIICGSEGNLLTKGDDEGNLSNREDVEVSFALIFVRVEAE